jgi:hypothetical protein
MNEPVYDKWFDIAVEDTFTPLHTWQVVVQDILDDIPRGTGPNSRIGDEIVVSKIAYEISYQHREMDYQNIDTGTGDGIEPDMMRFCVLRDPNARSLNSATDPFITVINFRQFDYASDPYKDYVFMEDKRQRLPIMWSGLTNVDSSAPARIYYQYGSFIEKGCINYDTLVHYDDSTGNVINDNVHFLMCGNGASLPNNNFTGDGFIRIFFRDS